MIPCYAGISNIHLNYNGEVWPCCVLGYDKAIGNLRDSNYDFQKILNSDQAREVKEYIKNKKCACPLANQWYSNILCNFRQLAKVAKNMLYMKSAG